MNAVIFLFCSIINSVKSWTEVPYKSITTDEWRENFKNLNGPSGRSGHTLVLYQETKLILFGGRDNDAQRRHVPTTLDVVDKDGILEFATYDAKPIREAKLNARSWTQEEMHSLCNFQETCVSFANATASGNTRVCAQQWTHPHQQNMTQQELYEWEETCGFVPISVYYNDVWMLDLAQLTSSRNNATWVLLHPGSAYGSCQSKYKQSTAETHSCQTPSERWRHGSTMLDEHTMVVYGGNSQSCDDYCDDLWAFDLRTNLWYELSSPSRSLQDVAMEWKSFASTPKDYSAVGPGVRWRFTMLGGLHPTLNRTILVIFGGHRRWDNGIRQNASSFTFKTSGYLNDLWMYVTGEKDVSSQQNNGSKLSESTGEWIQLKGKDLCDIDAITKDSCRSFWPRGRAGYAAVYDKVRSGIWMHGGYSAYYPYGPFQKNVYSGADTTTSDGGRTVGMTRVVPYHSESFYLDDLWFYDIVTGIWELKKPVSVNCPAGRTGHTIVVTNDSIVLFGGYSNNIHLNDTWHYFPMENKWLKKDTFENALFPFSCTDDTQVLSSKKKCVLLSYPQDDSDYTPSPKKPLYFGIVDNAEAFVHNLKERYLKNVTLDKNGNRIWIASDVPDGTPIAPNAATGPRQYAQLRVLEYNSTFHVHVWERCTSVYAEPTRGRITDGQYGRSNGPLFIPQLRRKSPGWDGCRGLSWIGPSHRSDHASIYVNSLNAIVVHGGRGYGNNKLVSTYEVTHDTRVVGDLWITYVDGCLNNCSNHGVCKNGFCKCESGFYGLDCSNQTCPGSVCFYDANFIQQCTHCCYDGYVHSDEDVPVTGVQKLACRRLLNGDFTGRSEGICDGFGSCMCAPPFIGDDCSIKNCKNNCSENGYCTVEYPVSRCVCHDGYYGDFCQHRICLNNCSLPNGVCNTSTGECICSPILSPFNSSQVYAYWEGEDCSYLTAWFSSSPRLATTKPSLAPFFLLISFLILHSWS